MDGLPDPSWHQAETGCTSYHGFAMLSEAFKRAKSTDPVKVAAVMEGMKFKSFNGEVEMRKQDHQLQQGLQLLRSMAVAQAPNRRAAAAR